GDSSSSNRQTRRKAGTQSHGPDTLLGWGRLATEGMSGFTKTCDPCPPRHESFPLPCPCPLRRTHANLSSNLPLPTEAPCRPHEPATAVTPPRVRTCLRLGPPPSFPRPTSPTSSASS